MRLFIHHRTDYAFSEPQDRLVQLLRMTPASNAAQNIVDWRIDVSCNARLRPARDGFGNIATMLYVRGPIERISLTVTGEVLTDDRAGMLRDAPETLPAGVFLQTTRLTGASDAIRALAQEVARGGGDALDRAHRLNSLIGRRLRFDPGRRNDGHDAATAFAEGHGVARDFTHVFIAASRALGIPARYVSGHVFRPGKAHAWHEAAHAWAEAHVDEFGWIGFDPTCDRCPDDHYVRVATGLDYRDAAPVSGHRTGGGEEALAVGVRVGTEHSYGQG